MASYIGLRLGSYQLQRLLGQGGSAQVYLGEHIFLKTFAAIKILHTQLSQREQEKFLYEARVIAHLEHPHIVRLLDYGVEQGVAFLVMSYAPNGTMRQRYPRGSILPLPQVLAYTGQIASALTYSHSEHVIHRDLKPDNLLIGRQKEVLLSDFGIAVVIGNEPSLSHKDIVGTPTYMAPEQFFGKASPASDQYALGTIVYEWLCGKRPFPPDSPGSALYANAPLPLHQQLPGIALDIEQVIMRTLAYHPQQRFESVQEFAQALEAASLPTYRAMNPAYIPPALRPSQLLPIVKPAQPLSPAQPLPDARAPLYTPPASSPDITEPVRTRGVSRRSTLLGIAGFAGLTLGGMATGWFIASRTPGPDGSLVAPEQILHVYTPGISTLGKATSVTWSPDGRYIASSYGPTAQPINPAIVWNSRPPFQQVHLLEHSAELNQMAWSYNSQHIAAGGGDNLVSIWDVASGNMLAQHQQGSPVDAIAWSPKALRLASGGSDHRVLVWSDTKGGDPAYVFTGHADKIWALAWSPDGRYIASGGSFNDRTVQVWDANNGQVMQYYKQHGSHISGIAWSPDGTAIASCSYDQTVRVWKVASGDTVLTLHHDDAIAAVDWSPDGQFIASTAKTVLQVWDATNGNKVYSRTDAHWLASVAWSPLSFGHYLAYCDDPNGPANVPSPNNSGQIYTVRIL